MISDNGDHPDFQKSLKTLLDIFGGVDGGVKFIYFRTGMNSLYHQMEQGGRVGYDAGQIVGKFEQVCNLIDYLADPKPLT